ncbi:calcium-binding protein [Pararhizobium sp. LjRoot238]|uniref:calcium-binding protein n=1 Tax=Pararhizobium sp. LjRoot238 TaxID=3342293 RepID=UPI003ED0F219
MALTNITEIEKKDFLSTTVAFLKKWENAGLIGDTQPSAQGGIHDDGKQIPTIGYGLNLKALSFGDISKAYKLALTGKIDGKLSTLQENGLKIIEKWKTDTTPTVAEDVALISKSEGKAGTAAEKKALQSLWLSDAQASVLLEARLKGHPGLFSSSIETELTARLNGFGATLPEQSQERLVLYSLYYNAPTLIGPGISAAIKTNNHASFWYEVRYNHSNFNVKGLQNRREEESSKVGILAPADREDAGAVLKAMDFLFDREGGTSSVYEKIAARDKVINETDQANTKTESFEAQVSAYLKILSDKYAGGDQLHFVQAGGSGNDTFAAGVASYARFDAKTMRNETNTNDLVIAGDGNNAVKTGGGDDWVYSGKGRDRIDLGAGDDHASAGAGDDVINGGDGSDVMKGGKGYDTYVIDDVSDRVVDGDRGKIKTEISLNVLTQNIDTYVNLKAGLTHTLKLDAAKLPTDPQGGVANVNFEGSSGNDTYRLSLTGDSLLAYFKTGAGNDKLILTGRENPETGTTTIFVEDAASSDRFDISVFDARSLDAFQGTAQDIGDYFYKLESQSDVTTMVIWYAADNGDGGASLNKTVSIASTETMSDAMFIV